MSYMKMVFQFCIVFFSFTAGVQAREKSPLKQPTALAQKQVIKGLYKISALNSSSEHACKIGDDDEEESIENLITCDDIKPLKGACFNTENTPDGYVNRTNIASMKCSLCDLQIKVIAKIREHTPQDEAAGKLTFQNFNVDFPQTDFPIDSIKQKCWDYVKGKNFDYQSEGDGDLADVISRAGNIRDLFELQEQGFASLIGRHEDMPMPEIIGFQSEGECENTIEDHNEVAQYKADLKRPSPQPVFTDEPKIYHFGMAVNKGKTKLQIPEFPQLKNVFTYQIHNEDLNKEDTERQLNYYIDPTYVPLKKDVKFKLKPDDLKNKIHHFVFEEKPVITKELEAYLNKNVNLRFSYRVINPACDSKKPEHINITTVQPSGTPITERYVLNCQLDQKQRKILSLQLITQ